MSSRNFARMLFCCALIGVYSCSDDAAEARLGINASWVDTVYAFSSEFVPSTPSWNAGEIIGEPNVYPYYGDVGEAWASENQDDRREYLEFGFLSFNRPAQSIAVFETFNPGAIDTVYVRNPSTQAWVTVWSGKAFEYGDSSRIFVVQFPKTDFDVRDVRLAIASDSISGWNEIDAIAISEEILSANYDSSGFYE